MLALDNGVTPRDADVIDTNLRLVAATQLKLRLLRSDGEQVHISRVVLVEGHGLEQNVVVVVAIDMLGHVHNLIDGLLDLKSVWVHLLADLALKPLPVETAHIRQGTLLWHFLLLLSLQPVLQALEVNQAD